MVRVRERREPGREDKMTEFSFQSNWIQHLNRTKSIRLRHDGQGGATAANRREAQAAALELSINRRRPASNQLAKPAAANQMLSAPAPTLMLLARRANEASGGSCTTTTRTTTTSGNQLKISTLAQVRPRQRTSGNRLSSLKSTTSTATRTAKLTRQPHLMLFATLATLRRAAIMPPFALILAMLLAANEILLCNCDNNNVQQTTRNNNNNNNPSGNFKRPLPQTAESFPEVSNQQPQQWQASYDRQRRLDAAPFSSASPAALSPSRMVHKEKILSSLADNIERQHMRLSPVGVHRSIGSLARPSKFDSGSESDLRLDGDEPARLHSRSSQPNQPASQSAAAAASKQRAKTLDDIMNQHYQLAGGAAKKSSLSSTLSHGHGGGGGGGGNFAAAGSKADQDLRQIMALHEQPMGGGGGIAGSHAQSTNRFGSQAGGGATAGGNQQQQQQNLIGKHLAKLKSLTSGAEPFIAAMVANKSANAFSANNLWSLASQPLLAEASKTSTKVLANVASLLSPAAVASSKRQPAPAPHRNLTNPFTARTNAKTFLVGPLLGLGQMFASPESQADKKLVNKYSMPVSGGGAAGDNQATYVLSNAINQPQGYTSQLKGLIKGRKQSSGAATDSDQDLLAEASSLGESSAVALSPSKRPSSSGLKSPGQPVGGGGVGGWIKNGANQLAQSYLQDSFRDLLTLTQLPILSNGPVSTAPSELELGGKKYTANRGSNQLPNAGGGGGNKNNKTQAIDDFFRYAYILANLGVRRKRDPLKALGSSPSTNSLILAQAAGNRNPLFSLRGHMNQRPNNQNPLIRLPALSVNSLLANRKIKPRGVMWDMATDPSLAVTVFHLLERASVALPLGFLLMPFVHMIRNPLNGINLGRIIPARASHRSVDYEELAKRIDMMDKILSRALRPTHRESPTFSFIKR